MSVINRNNYEEFFLDYLDGNLTEELYAELMVFFDNNPDLKNELDEFSGIKIQADNISIYHEKDDLKKTLIAQSNNIENIQDIIIAKIEGDLSQEQEKELDEFLDQSEYWSRELRTFEKLELKPDLSIEFPEKQQLKKSQISISRVIRYAAMAASIILMVSFYILLPRLVDDSDIVEIAEYTQEAKKDKGSSDNIETKEVEKKKDVTIQVEKTTPDKINKTEQKIIDEKPLKIDEKQDKELKEVEKINFVIRNAEPIRLAEAKPVQLYVQPANGEQYVNIYTLPYNFDPRRNHPINKAHRFLIAKINDKVFKKDKSHPGSQSLTLWDVADAGVDGINKVFKSNMELKQVYDQNGQLEAVKFDSKLLSFHTPVKN